MKTVNNVIQYQYKHFVMSGKWIMPCIALVAFVATLYSILPVRIVSSYSISGLFLFLIMVWLGVMTQEIEPKVSEQIMVLRLKSDKKYYLCHVLFLVMLSGVVSMGMLLFPIVINLIRMNQLFDRSICWTDVFGGMLLMFSCSVIGMTTGELFHIRIVRNNLIVVVLPFMFGLFALVRSGILEEHPVSKYILWMIPPVSDVVSCFSNQEYFDLAEVGTGSFLLMCYAVLFTMIKIALLCRAKF